MWGGGCCYWEGGKVCKETLVKIETEAIDRAVWQQILTILPAGNGQIYQGHHFMARAFLQYNLWFLPKRDLKRRTNFGNCHFCTLMISYKIDYLDYKLPINANKD